MTHTPLTGRCLCGSVLFRTLAPPDRVLNCHCESCHRHGGAPMACLAVFAPDQVAFSGAARARYASAPNVYRGFCETCGSSLTWETVMADGEKVLALHISAFDTPEALPPEAHTFYGERVAWFEALDDLPRHDGFQRETAPVQVGPGRR